jgi:hypothetical protein
MKKNANSAWRCNRQSFVFTQPLSLLLVMGMIALSFTSCKKEASGTLNEEIPKINSQAKLFNLDMYTGLSSTLQWELQQARAASAKYQQIKNAIKDGYIDIDVEVEHMGFHYMRTEIVDPIFDITKPEILVYNQDHDGNIKLVAVEYAIPLNLPRPEGFTGNMDNWDDTSGFPFWLLHAWVWEYNPSGVFNPTNPNVHLH